MTISPAKARKAISAITTAMAEVQALEVLDDKLGGNVYQQLVDARRDLSTYVSNEWDKSHTMEAGAD